MNLFEFLKTQFFQSWFFTCGVIIFSGVGLAQNPPNNPNPPDASLAPKGGTNAGGGGLTPSRENDLVWTNDIKTLLEEYHLQSKTALAESEWMDAYTDLRTGLQKAADEIQKGEGERPRLFLGKGVVWGVELLRVLEDPARERILSSELKYRFLESYFRLLITDLASFDRNGWIPHCYPVQVGPIVDPHVKSLAFENQVGVLIEQVLYWTVGPDLITIDENSKITLKVPSGKVYLGFVSVLLGRFSEELRNKESLFHLKYSELSSQMNLLSRQIGEHLSGNRKPFMGDDARAVSVVVARVNNFQKQLIELQNPANAEEGIIKK